MIDKSEKYLKSIDNTLSDILKELKIINHKGVSVKKETINHDIHLNSINVAAGHKYIRPMTSEYL